MSGDRCPVCGSLLTLLWTERVCLKCGCRPELKSVLLTKLRAKEYERLMMEDCSPVKAGGQPFAAKGPNRPTVPSFFSPLFQEAGCPPEVSLKTCSLYDPKTHVCGLDGSAWCGNPYTDFCSLRDTPQILLEEAE